MAKTLYMLGYLVGSVASGALADRYGRRTAVLGSCLCASILNFIAAWSPNVELFMLTRTLAGACCIAFFGTGLVLCTELVRKDQRVYPRATLSVVLDILAVTFALVSMIIRDHRYLQTCMASEMLFFFLVMCWFLPESPRWLASQNRHKEAAKIVARFAKFNDWPTSKLSHLKAGDDDDDGKSTKRSANLADLVRTPLIRKRCIALCVIWFCHVMSYYAIVFNMDTFYHDVRISIMISSAVELVTRVVPIYGLKWLGRQFLAWAFLVIAGVCCFAMLPFLESKGWALLGIAVTGKLFLTNLFFITYLYTQELFPTVIRSQGLGLASSVSRIGGMLAPQIALLDDLWRYTSAVTLGSAAIVGALLIPLLPDTTGCELPQSLKEGEEFLADHKYKLVFPKKEVRNRGESVGGGSKEDGTELRESLTDV